MLHTNRELLPGEYRPTLTLRYVPVPCVNLCLAAPPCPLGNVAPNFNSQPSLTANLYLLRS